MIESIRLINFQSHKDSLLEFSKGVNIIVGSTDKGKSAIIRAINLVLNNRPTGDNYRSDWGGDTEIHLKTKENLIKRIRTSSKNLYILDKTEFKAFGTNPPEEVLKALNMNSINIDFQFDPPFLLSNTSGEVSAFFNKLAKLEKIDIATKNANTSIKKVKNSIEYDKKTLIEKKKALQNFEYLEEAEREMNQLLELNKKHSSLVNKAFEIEKNLAEIDIIIKKLETLTTIINDEKNINEILNFHKEKISKQKQLEDLITVCTNINYINKEIENINYIKNQEDTVNKILTINKRKTKINNSKKLLNELTNTVQNYSIKLTELEKYIKNKQIKLEKDFPNICPLCNSKIKNGKN